MNPAPAPPASRADPAVIAARERAGPGLYVHVPFCAVRCVYCDFSSGSLSRRAVESWFEALEREMALRAPAAAGVRFRSLFLGGGTPSALDARAFRRLWSGLRGHFEWTGDAEITVEVNPESAKPARLEAWRAAGVNRLSFGVQSFHAPELSRLGRIHGPERPGEAVGLARSAGFDNVSIDLMYGFPGHRAARWNESLERALALAPEHLSAYNYIPERGTPMGEEVLDGRVGLPSAGEQAAMYRSLRERLGAAGFTHYEISNFCRPGRASRHNLAYWLRRDYLGLGPSAHSLWRGERWGNHYAAAAYARAMALEGEAAAERERPGAETAAEEALFLGLRLPGGLRLQDYEPALARTLAGRFGAVLEAAVRSGELRRAPGGWAIPATRLFLADEVMARLLARADRAPSQPRVDTATEPCLVS